MAGPVRRRAAVESWSSFAAARTQRAARPNKHSRTEEAMEHDVAAQMAPQGVGAGADLMVSLIEARESAAHYRQQYLRALADMENHRRRVARRYADEARQTKKALLLKLLDVLDNLERAIHYRSTGGPPKVEAIAAGVRLTHAQFADVLAPEGVTPVETVGAAFDPALHDAVAPVAASGRPVGEIVAEVRKGYRFD